MENSEKKFTFIRGKIYTIPKRMRPSLLRYIEKGVSVGHFLTAVLENNLVNAIGYADEENLDNLPAYTNYLYNYAPMDCWGTAKKVKDWIETKSK